MEEVKKMQKKTLLKIINLFLWFGPFLDAFTALMIVKWNISLTIGVVIRFLYLIFLISYLIFMREDKGEKKKTLFVLFLFLLYFIGFILLKYQQERQVVFSCLKALFRSFYFPLLLFTLSRISHTKKIEPTISSFPKLYFVYLFFIIVPNLLGIGLATYQVTKEGKMGLFYSANEISAILSILMPFYFEYLYRKQNFFLTVFGSFLLIFILLSIGTKGPLLSLGILMLLFGYRFIKDLIHSKKWKTLGGVFACFVSLMCLLIIVLPSTSFYKNIKVHLDFLEVDNVFEIFKDFHLVDHFIFSSRLSFWQKSHKMYQKAPISNQLLGLGYYDKGQEVKMIEMDPIDVFYRHGIIGFLLYFGTVLLIILPIFKNLFQKRNKGQELVFKSSLFLMILLAFFTGHILLAPAVSIYVVYLLVYLEKREEVV